MWKIGRVATKAIGFYPGIRLVKLRETLEKLSQDYRPRGSNPRTYI